MEDNKINQVFEANPEKKEKLDLKKIAKSYFSNIFATSLGIIILLFSFGGLFYSDHIYGSSKVEYDRQYSNLLTSIEKEKESEVKKIVTNIGISSNLVYNLSIFHTPPKTILEEVEKAIYLGPDTIITDENINFTNYNQISFGLITQDLKNFAILIKKLKKLYSETFKIDGMQDFGIEYEKNDDGQKTGKVFFTTKITLTYLKDPGSNLAAKGVLEDQTEEDLGLKSIYENNEIAFKIFGNLVKDLANKRKKEGKAEKYVTATTEDNSMYLGTDIEYLGKNIYYIMGENVLSDLFDLNGIGTKEDYQTLKESKIKLLFTTSKDGSQYGLCTKILKQKEELSALENEETNVSHTKVVSEGALANSIRSLCELL